MIPIKNSYSFIPSSFGIEDMLHFSNLPLPLYPNENEVSIYEKNVLNNNTLLLGYTKQLIHLSIDAMDLNPPENTKVIKKDWFTIDKYYDTIIGDGVLNLVGGDLVQYLSKYCRKLIIRFFTEKIKGMKYATYFRYNTNLLLPDVIIDTQESCKILIWNFEQ